MTYRSTIKRWVDLVGAAIGLLAASPLLFLSAVLVKLTSPGPLMFSQERAGLNGEPFRVLKLRTMTVDHNRGQGQTTAATSDVIPVGRVLRRLKIDELPQLINVLRGDMSMVGPRPCLMQTRDEMPTWACKRFGARPGLTGLAQVNGNVALSWEERWQYDAHYVESVSLKGDVAILLKTLLVLFAGEDRFRRSM